MKKRSALWLFLILIIALFLRTYHLKELPPGLYPDEAMDGNNALHALHTGQFSVFYPENNGREGLFMNVQAPFIKFLGNTPWVLRLPSALFGFFTVLGLYFLTKELLRANTKSQASNIKQIQNSNSKNPESLGTWDLKFGISPHQAEVVALLSTYFLATSFWHINFSRISFRAISAPFFMVWALYFLFLGYRKIREEVIGTPDHFISREFIRACPWHMIGGIIFGLGAYTYIAYRTMPAVVFVVFIYFYLIARREGWVRRFIHTSLHYTFFALLTSVPLLYYFAIHPGSFFGRTSQVSVFSGGHTVRDLALNILKTIGMFFVAGDYNWRQNVAGRPEIFWPVGICLIVGIVWGIKSIASTKSQKSNSKEIQNSNNQNVKRFGFLNLENWNLFGIWNVGFGTLFAWIIFAALPVVLSNEGIPHALRSILMIPPVFILAGLGASKIYQFIQKFLERHASPRASHTFHVACFLVLALLFVEAYTTYFIIWGKNPNVPGSFTADYVTLGEELNALPTSTPKYVVVKAGGVLVNGIPMPAQTTMYITDTWDTEQQNEKNIHYVLPEDENKIPSSSLKFYIQ